MPSLIRNINVLTIPALRQILRNIQTSLILSGPMLPIISTRHLAVLTPGADAPFP